MVNVRCRQTSGYQKGQGIRGFQDDSGQSWTARLRKRQESNLPKTPARLPTGLKPARPTGSGTLPHMTIAAFVTAVNRLRVRAPDDRPADAAIRRPWRHLVLVQRAVRPCTCPGQ